jgi:hypothetical protein
MSVKFLKTNSISNIKIAQPILTIEYLVVAGGGGGGRGVANTYGGGGGGAGGYLTGTLNIGSSFTVTVGAGGASETNGINSVCSSIISIGGGGAAPGSGNGQNGGSGGGAGYGGALGGTGTAGPPRQGFNGGGSGSNTGSYGGGAGSAGGGYGSASGFGLNNYISGTLTTYASGGRPSDSTNGTANTGNGGDGRPASGNTSGFLGGSGIVIISYVDTFPALTNIAAGLTYTQPTKAGYRVYRFTAGTGTVVV